MGDRFHRAARDGSTQKGLELLKEATSRDLNRYFCSIAGKFRMIYTLCKNSECEKTSFVKKCFWNYFLSSFSAFKNMTFIVLKHQTIFIGWQWSIVCYIIRQLKIFISILKFKWVFPAQKCCMSDYVRKINRELAIFSQLRNFIRQFTNFSIWGSIICLRLGIPLAI